MLNRRTFLISLSSLVLPACTTEQIIRASRTALEQDAFSNGTFSTENLKDAALSVAQNRAQGWANNPDSFQRDLKQLQQFAGQFARDVIRVWGEQDARSSDKDSWVKYTDRYQSRGIIDFRRGVVRVETLQPDRLKEAIIMTILSPDDPDGVDLFSDRAIKLGAEPFLYNQVVDHDGKAMRWRWRASRFADYLIRHRLHKRQVIVPSGQRRVETSVEFSLLRNSSQQRQQRYSQQVNNHSQKYQQDPALVYAIIETESHFNPFAVSWVPAYGLMQIVPKTAGRDAWKLIHGRDGTPSRDYLFNADNNIRMGCAYLYILQSRYLANINHPRSQEYCIIAAYNGGAGNVLRCFSSNRNSAFRQINQLSPSQVYERLRSRMPEESRHYLKKVTQAKERYQ
ncbi:MAG: murein transglycosylase domain-containing protein [Marinobacterium sp.]|nr:murein transglycosylase domain-containing protein [Marinobacterium sp.]